MWLLSLPLPAERRLALPPGQHCFPWYYNATEIGRLAEFLAGILKDVERHWILPWPTAQVLLSATTGPDLHTTLVVITFPDQSVDSETLDNFLAHAHCRHVMLHFSEPRELGYAWQEKYLKRDLIDSIQEEISLETHPLASLQVSHLPVRLAATLTTDVLGLVDLLEATLLHRLEHSADGTNPEHYQASLSEVAGRRFAERLLRLLPEQREAAIEVLRKEGAGVWQDEQFRDGARALQEVGLARIGEGSASLGPLARRANENWLLPILHQLSSRRAQRRWVAETSLAVEQAPEEWADFARASLSTLTSLLTVFRTVPESRTGQRNDLERVRVWIREGSTFQERCARAQDFLTDPERSRFVRTSEADDYALWFEPIRAEFTGRDLDGFRFDWSGTIGTRIGTFLSRHPRAKLDVARWMAFALFENTFVDEKEHFADLLTWLWRTILQDNDEAAVQQEGLGVVRRCLALAQKNNYERAALIERDAVALGIDVASVLPAGKHASEFILTMKAAFEKMLDEDFIGAQQLYAKAASMAQYGGDAFGEWVALNGEIEARSRNIDPRFGTYPLNTRDETDPHIERLSRAPDVTKWVERSRTLRNHLTEILLEEAIQDQELDGMLGTDVHEYFTMFRDLETMYAPPALQSKFIRPLIAVSTLDIQEKFRYQLQLNIGPFNTTTAWLLQTVRAPEADIADARQRDQSLVVEFRRPAKFRQERLQRLQLLPHIIVLFQNDELIWARDFLSAYRNDFGIDSGAKEQRSSIYTQALCTYAAIDTKIEAIEYFLSFDQNSASRRERGEIVAKLNAGFIPLVQWLGLHESLTTRLGDYVLQFIRRFPTSVSIGNLDELPMRALLNIFLAARRFAREISIEVVEEARISANSWLRHDVNGTVHLAYLLAPDGLTRNELLGQVLHLIATANPQDGDFTTRAVPFAKWLELREAGVNPTNPDMHAAAEKLWRLLLRTWDNLIEVANNIRLFQVGAHVAFLTQWLASGSSTDPPAVRQKLLQLLAHAPQHLKDFANVIDPNLWQNDWPAFITLVRKLACGDHFEAMDAQIGAFDLLKQWANQYHPAMQLLDDASFLVDAALWAIADENHRVAHHAAYAIAAYAMHAQTPQDVRRVADGLRRLAIDPRVNVRGAAAYAGKRLPLVEGIHADIRAAAREIDEQLADDTYAIINRERVFGELAGKYPPQTPRD